MKYYSLALLVLCISITSCRMASYQSSYDSDAYSVDYREGKWLLNNIDCPLTIKDRMTELTIQHFKDKLGDNFRDANTDTSIALSFIPLNPDSLLLKRLKKESRSDYIINIKGNILENDIGGMKTGSVTTSKTNSAQTTLQIYDLNTLEIIYNRTVTGSVSINEHDDKKFAFVTEAHSMILSSLKKILKKLD